MLTLPQRTPKNLEIYKIHPIEVFNGPVSSLINLKSKYVMVEDDKPVKIYEKCSEEDGNYYCSNNDEIFGNEKQCIQDIFTSKGLSNSCEGKLIFAFDSQNTKYRPEPLMIAIISMIETKNNCNHKWFSPIGLIMRLLDL